MRSRREERLCHICSTFVLREDMPGNRGGSMAFVFISHSSHDNAEAERIRQSLKAVGFSSVYLDFDPESGIPPGRKWENELYSELRKADVVVFLSTAAGVNSKWCHAELALARALGRTIVPVLLEPGAMHPLLEDTQWLRVEPGNGKALESALKRALERFTLDPRFGLSWDKTKSPYPGLHPFDESRAGVFYGRDDEVADVLKNVTWPHAEGSERIVLVMGPSGCGKSSLVRAGVLPRLRRREGPWVIVPPFTPSDDPFARLGDKLAEALVAAGVESTSEACAKRVRAGELSAVLGELCRAASVDETRGGVVLTIDQAEQLATDSSAERVEFIGRLSDALDSRIPLRAIATLREEYLSRVVAGTPFDGRVLVTVPLGPISREFLADVIEKPARDAGLDFEEGLVERMVTETASGIPSGGDPLPLLAFTLERMYELRTSPTRITSADYVRVGGVAGALRTEADALYNRLTQRGRGPVIIDTLLELVHTESEDVQPTGRTARRADFDDGEWEVVEAFVKARLLTTEGPGPSVTVAHESLLRDWPVLSDAIADARSRLVARTRLEREARVWEVGGRNSSDLLSPARLKAARAAWADDHTWRPSVVAAFLDASRAQVRRGRAVTFAVAAGVVLVLLAVAVGGWFGFDWWRERGRIQDAQAVLIPVGQSKLDGHEVTYAQYRLCLAEGRCPRPGKTRGAPDYETAPGTAPVRYIDAAAAEEFCDWIERRLPTLDELERAADIATFQHLLDRFPQGGREWTSTPAPAAQRWALWRNPKTGQLNRTSIDPSRAELDTGFRCAVS
jgi:energy-coupling factor transporter ATP-binding protein EcfA2